MIIKDLRVIFLIYVVIVSIIGGTIGYFTIEKSKKGFLYGALIVWTIYISLGIYSYYSNNKNIHKSDNNPKYIINIPVNH